MQIYIFKVAYLISDSWGENERFCPMHCACASRSDPCVSCPIYCTNVVVPKYAVHNCVCITICAVFSYSDAGALT